MKLSAITGASAPWRLPREIGGWRTALSVLVSAASVLFATKSGDEAFSQQLTPPIREAYVPADEPEAWPTGKWFMLPADEYRQLLKDLSEEPAPPPASLSQVTYSATFADDSLTGGQFSAEIRHRGNGPAYLSLGQPTCALRNLEWPDRPAEWGLSPDGETRLRVPSDSGPLKGEWSLRGREYFGRVEFQATFLPAVISRLELRLPADKRIIAPEDVSVHVDPADDSSYRLWHLDLGQRPQIHFMVSDASADEEIPVLLAERISRYSLRPDGLHFQVDFQIESRGGDTEELVFAISRGMTVTSVSLANELELPFHRDVDSEQGVGLVRVPLEARLLEGRTSVALQGTLPLPSDGEVVLPQVSLKHFPLVSSRLHVTVHRPLELSDYDVHDCRLISSTLIRHQTDHLELEDWSDDSQVTVVWDVPRADVVAEVLASANLSDAHPISRTLMRLTTRSGSTYELTCRVPKGWEVTRVTSQPWHLRPRIASWKVAAAEEGASELEIEFRDALSSSVPVLVDVWATRTMDQWKSAIDTPLVLPLVSDLRHVHLTVQPPEGRAVMLPSVSSYRSVEFVELRDAWAGVVDNWDEWRADPLTDPVSDALLTLHAESPSSSETLLMTSVTRSQGTAEANAATASDETTKPLDNLPRVRDSQSTPLVPRLLADVTVTTVVAASTEQDCLQTVTYEVRAPLSLTEVEFTLSPPAEWITGRVHGHDAAVTISDRLLRVQVAPAAEPTRIEVEYRVPFSQSLLWGHSGIPLPESALSIASIRWRLQLPDALRVHRSTSGAARTSPSVGWRQRLLGPLGLPPGKPAFWPFSRSDASAADRQKTLADESSQGDRTLHRSGTARYRSETRSVPFTANGLKLIVWKLDQARHLGWALLVAALVAIVTIRQSAWGASISTRLALFLAAGLVAAIVPEALAIPCGGLFLGMVIGNLLPLRWPFRRAASRKEHQSLGSTRTLVGAASPLILIALLIGNDALAFQAADSQSASSPSEISPVELRSDVPPPPVPAYDALIPTQSDKPTLEETPVVYVSPALMKRWNARRSTPAAAPPYLLRSASYKVTADYQSRPHIAADFDVVILDRSKMPRITLPLRDIAVDDQTPCRVNGQSATIIPLRDGKGIAVVAPQMERFPLPEEDANASGEETREQRALLHIELAFRPRPNGQQPSRRFQIPIPPLLSATAEVDAGLSRGKQASISGRGAMQVDSESGRIETDLGPTSTLEVDWNSPAQSTSRSVVFDRAVSHVEVHPRQFAVRTRLGFSTTQEGEGSLQTVELTFPENASFDEVRVPGLINSIVVRRTAQPTKLLLALDRRARERTDLEIAYQLPVTSTAGTVNVPSLPLVAQADSSQSVPHIMGFVPAPGFQVSSDAMGLLSEGTTPVTPALFAQAWGETATTVAELAFSVAHPQPLTLIVAPVQATREAAVREQLTVDRSRLFWEAEIEIDSRDVPVAMHRLGIDPRIRLSAVRVTQNEADRLVRWSRQDASQVALLLTDELLGRQTVYLAGDVPLDPNQSMDLPRLSLPQSSVTQHELQIRSPSGWTVDVLNAQGESVETLPERQITEQASSFDFNETYDLLVNAPATTIRVSEADAAFHYEQIASLSRAEDGQLRLRNLIRFSEEAVLPPLVVFSVSPEWTRTGPVKTKPELLPGMTQTGGSNEMLLDTRSSERMPRSVEFETTIPHPVEETWTLPKISVRQGSLSRQILVLSGNVLFEPVNESQVIALDEQLLSTSSFAGEPETTRRRAFVANSGNWRLSRGDSRAEDDHVQRIDTAIWEIPQEGFAGITAAVLSLDQTREVSITIPENIEIVTARWAGRMLPMSDQQLSSLNLTVRPNDPSRQEHRLELWWRQRGPARILHNTIALPRIEKLSVVTETVAFLGDSGNQYSARGKWEPLDLRQALVGPSAAGFPPDPQSPVTEAIQAAGFASPFGADSWKIDASLPVLLGRVSGKAEDVPASSVSLWSVNRSLPRVLLITFVIAIAGAVVWKFDLGPKLQNYRPNPAARACGGFILLGSLLWMMGPSGLGFWLLVFGACAWAILAWRMRRSETSFVLESQPSP